MWEESRVGGDGCGGEVQMNGLMWMIKVGVLEEGVSGEGCE